MTDVDRLLAAVLANPDEDTPRLLYADALDERGQPGDASRAKFIRNQIAGEMGMLRLTWLIPFEQFFGCQPHQLGRVSTAGKAWVYHIPSGKRITFRRGFVESVTCLSDNWWRHEGEILAAHPVREVTLTTWPMAADNQYRQRGIPAIVRQNLRILWPGIKFVLPDPPPHLPDYTGYAVSVTYT